MNKQNVLIAIVAALAGGGLVHLYGPGRSEPTRSPVEQAASTATSPVATGDRPIAAPPSGDAALPGEPVAAPAPAGAKPARGDASRPASRSAPSPSPAHATAYGPFETTFFTGEMLNDNVQVALSSEQFERAVDQLRGEADAHGIEMQEAYRMEFEDALRSTRAAARVRHFACASNLCMGSIEGPDFDWLPAWQHELRGPGRLPMPSLALHRVVRPGAVHSLRFMFTTRGRGGFVTKAPSARAPR